MKKILHTLYILDSDLVVEKKNQALRILHKDGRNDHFPLEMIENIVVFSKIQIKEEVFQMCAEKGIDIWVLDGNARVRYRITGKFHGNVTVRKEQCLLSESREKIPVIKAMITGKIKNLQFVLAKFKRSHSDCERESMDLAIRKLKECEQKLQFAETEESIRAVESQAARIYFQVFPYMILRKEPEFQFTSRNRRPPKDPVNALLSYTYTLLMMECVTALESAGVDPYVGLLHTDRSGKASMALDMMEEFRPLLADRLVLRLLNLKMIKKDMFEQNKEGIYLNNIGKRLVIQEWRQMKEEKIFVEEIEEMVPKGLFPSIQAQKLVRFLKGELSEYTALTRR